ncbi:MAG: molybdate ABC transporter substrate-binding protein [Clostridia bacterium]
MKKTSVFITIIMIFVLATACKPAQNADAKTELTVFAAASMTEAMTELTKAYKLIDPNVTITYNFDSSGTLKTQIQEGANCDIFISAGQKQMNQLDKTANADVNTEGLDFVLKDTRFNLVSNEVVLIVPANSTNGITDFADILTDKTNLIAIGNSDVPAGQYAEEVFKSLNMWDALLASNKVSYATNVKEVLTQVASGAVDCGVVYSTDAMSESGVKVAVSAPEGSHGPIVYPAAVIKATENKAAAEKFMEYLKSDAAKAMFKKYGFSN